MKTKADLPLLAFEGQNLSAILAAYLEFNHLKLLYRQGWLKRGIPPEQCESVADHVFSMALLAWWTAQSFFPELDTSKIIRIALVHELGEIYTGDLTPSDGIETSEKHRLERQAFEQVVMKLPRGAEYLSLWEEYEQGQTAEARLVKQVDRLEMGLQALVYERQGHPNLDEFFASAGEALSDPRLRVIFQEALSLRK